MEGNNVITGHDLAQLVHHPLNLHANGRNVAMLSDYTTLSLRAGESLYTDFMSREKRQRSLSIVRAKCHHGLSSHTHTRFFFNSEDVLC